MTGPDKSNQEEDSQKGVPREKDHIIYRRDDSGQIISVQAIRTQKRGSEPEGEETITDGEREAGKTVEDSIAEIAKQLKTRKLSPEDIGTPRFPLRRSDPKKIIKKGVRAQQELSNIIKT